MRVAVLFGGISTERNVSISGGRAVVEALRSLGYDVIPVDPAFGKDGQIKAEEHINNINHFNTLEELSQFSPKSIIECINSEIFDNIDCAFIVLHGKYGEDGIIQSLLELRGIPYTGSGVKANAISIDKATTKNLMLVAGIPVPAGTLVSPEIANEFEVIKEIRNEFGNELVIKPNDQGSTIGLTIVRDGNLDEISRGIAEAGKYCRDVLIEQFIDGREITVGIVGDEALPVIEIIPESGFYDYEHKYTKGKTQYVCPAEIDEDIAEFVKGLSITAHNVIGCSGFSRVDFRLTEDGQPFFLEINTVPGFTATSLVPKAAKHLGIEFPELCDRIIKLALAEKK
ncbi:MAG TPA: D-alanine--D-alanine ligase [Candidatus Kapabacteria bacterium]|jgi:D-alanine-D-alanine ligase|nr:D-alanine--D-alanine ligase [Candidatus Kapabacteria bacterium]HOM05601.1 D-alanine--D-alanine ligase [Candidatus Kapabacteria bacterium]HPP39261.1 D-alanine--D-alanine ligase [Candidatus Kapabacteria bacterium]HPU23706.1 D-alanine--D-alanine ligase [Candidatus Kapabacteria bacterium]